MGTAISVDIAMPRMNRNDPTQSNMFVLLPVMFATEDTEITEVIKVLMTCGTSRKYVGLETDLTLPISRLFFSVYSVLSVAMTCQRAALSLPVPDRRKQEYRPE